jgi:hypothetical protein
MLKFSSRFVVTTLLFVVGTAARAQRNPYNNASGAPASVINYSRPSAVGTSGVQQSTALPVHDSGRDFAQILAAYQHSQKAGATVPRRSGFGASSPPNNSHDIGAPNSPEYYQHLF